MTNINLTYETQEVIVLAQSQTIEVDLPTSSVSVINSGPQGPRGNDAPSFLHLQNIAAAVWIVIHGLGKKPNVSVMSDGGVVYVTEILHIDVNTTHIIHNSPCTGSASFS